MQPAITSLGNDVFQIWESSYVWPLLDLELVCFLVFGS